MRGENYNTEVFPDPKDVPEGVFHGGSTAYNDYHCRCRHCAVWSRLTSSRDRYKRRVAQLERRRSVLDYLALKGVAPVGPGPFAKQPGELAALIARYLGDDLEAWLNGEGRSWR